MSVTKFSGSTPVGPSVSGGPSHIASSFIQHEFPVLLITSENGAQQQVPCTFTILPPTDANGTNVGRPLSPTNEPGQWAQPNSTARLKRNSDGVVIWEDDSSTILVRYTDTTPARSTEMTGFGRESDHDYAILFDATNGEFGVICLRADTAGVRGANNLVAAIKAA